MKDSEDRKPTPPSEAPGESGDRAARKEAEDAVVPGTGDGKPGDTSGSRSSGRHGKQEKPGRRGKEPSA
ncbi:hypothetical protein ABZ605_01630 [Streptomyces sp. NPDC012765]|uniref:hypothetical protein n=1 Tax=Streptomyces sp. NPDC012765 TaxID=3155249 RepID=UPI00340336FE